MAVAEEAREIIDTSGKPIQVLLNRARNIQKKCSDFNVTRVNHKNFRFTDTGNLRFIPDDGMIEEFPLNKYSLSQLGTKIGVPASYLQKCIDNGRCDLAADNVNSWVEDYDKDLFIREYDGHVRGILSSRYAACDTPDILRVLKDTVDLNNYKVKGSFLNEERLHLRLVGKEMLPIDGEDLFPGLFIDSSDVGKSVLTVQFGIYKQVCTNGLVVSQGGGTLFEQKHIGIKLEDFHNDLFNSLKLVDSLCEHSMQLIESCRKKSGKYKVSRMSEEDFDAFIAQIQGQTKLSRESSGKVIDLMREKYGDSKWGLINSITEVAQDFTLERRLELEKIAGRMLEAA